MTTPTFPRFGSPHSSSLDLESHDLVERIDGPHGMTSRVYLGHAALCRVAVNQRRIREMR